jgi:hypothetical protein
MSRRATRARSRAGERGATMFVVVLLITMLLGIGMFAARSASLASSSSGHGRQMTQAQYVADYGITFSKALLDGPLFQAIKNNALDPAFAANQSCSATGPCYKVCDTDYPEFAFFPRSSLGAPQSSQTELEAHFCVELTDWIQLPPPPGMGNNLNLHAYRVTATAVGQVRIRNTGSDPKKLDAAAAWTSSTQLSRAYFTTKVVGN